MIHLKEVKFIKSNIHDFPYNMPFFGETIPFSSNVTILVGENGAGKSTFLELIDEVLGLYKIKRQNQEQKEIQDLLKNVSRHVMCTYHLKKPKGFFFSAEDFTSYIHYLVQEKNEAYQELKRIEKEYTHKSSFAQSQAKMPYVRTVHDIDNMYQKDLLKSSHGEAYLDFFTSRIRENEIYLIDEPETPLSIQNQLTLLSIIDEAIKHGNQFIIATHSPVIMSIPYAHIYEIGSSYIRRINYDEIESVILLKQFMNQPESFFRHLYHEDK
ncbi:MAG: AAA family ATPase [Acholeplasmataceae bacterium]|jgi:predicted ATPase|nr:AAA family ATPase [Acholeplasmataceae bacterium]